MRPLGFVTAFLLALLPTALALDRLAAFAAVVTEADTAAVEAFESALALVAAAFPDADLSGVVGGPGDRSAGPEDATVVAGDGSAAAVDGLAA